MIPTEYISIILPILALLSVILIVWLIILELRIHRLLRDSNGNSLEKTLKNILKEYSSVSKEHSKLQKELQKLQQKTSSSIRGIGHVRFNPFAGSGDSRPSYAITFINDAGNGIVISSLHTRDRVTLFSKDIENFKPVSELSEEEQKSLDKARESLHNDTQ